MSLSQLLASFRNDLTSKSDTQSRRRSVRLTTVIVDVLTPRVLLSAVNPLPLASLNGTNGFRLDGVTAEDKSGASVSDAGDINGDGFDDLIIGAYGADPGGNSGAGSSYVVFGKSGGFTSAINLSTLNGANGFRLDGFGGQTESGNSVSSAGDVNGDGFDDLVIGAPKGISSGAASYVMFGKSSGFAPAIALSSLDGTNGFEVTGSSFGAGFGTSVSNAGDVNGDGFDDLLVGAFGDSGQAGSSYVLFGKSDGFSATISMTELDGTSGFRLDGVGTIDWSGYSVSSAGDVNGDGFDDLLIGAFQASPNSVTGAGSSFVVFGKSSGFSSAMQLSTLDGTNGFRLDGGSSSAQAGRSVSNAGDVNGDGFDDLIIGAWSEDPPGIGFAGISYVVFGKSGGFTSAVNLATINGTNGFQLNGASLDVSGGTVSGAGDLNGDGFDDLIVGNEFDLGFESSYVVFGKASGFSSSINLSTLNGTNGFEIDAATTSVSRAGDVNGDGFDDVIIGRDKANPGGNTNSGSSYVVFGGNFTGGLETKVGTSSGETLTANRGLSQKDILIGGRGNDTLISDGGSDVLIGGEGHDVLAIPNVDFSGTRRLSGGKGTNTLRLDGSGLTLDLTSIQDNRVVDFNEIDLTGSGINTLTLNLQEVLNLSRYSNSLIVRQDADDIINMGTGWIESGFEIIAASTFKVLTQGAAKLKVQIQGHAPSVTNAVTTEDVQTSSGLVISRHAVDGVEVSHFKITGITGGTLFQNDGTSPINQGDFITFAQANAGLKFTPSLNSFATGHFTVQSSLSNADSGVSGTPVIADILVSAVADTPNVTNVFTFTNTQTFTGPVISRNTADGSEVTHFKITGITGGVLFLNDGTSQISSGDFITFAQANAGLKFTPSLNSVATGHFTLQASTSGVDAGLGGSTVTADINVKVPPGVPSVTSATTSEDVQTTSGLLISRNSSDGAEVTHFRITGITGGKLFQSDGVSPINDGDFITSADAGAGLKFTPSPGFFGTGHFTVQAAINSDNSGAAGVTVTADIFVSASADAPSVSNASTNINTQTTSGLVISRNATDGAEVTHFRITNINGGSLFQNNGTTPVNDGDFITFAQANAGLKFTPTPDSTTTGHFTIRASLGNSDSGLGGSTVTADIAIRPAVPVLTGPASVTSNQRPTITWSASPGADHYVVSIWNRNSGLKAMVIKAVTGTSFTPATDLGIGRFSVGVRAISVSGASSVYSTERRFTIASPVIFEGVVKYQSTANPGLAWVPLTGAVKYDLWINNLTTGQEQVVREINLTGRSWNSLANLPMGGYRAWIRGIDAAQTPAAWSKPVDFYVLPTVQVTGAFRSTFDTTPTFKWNAVAGATGYDLYLRNLTTGKLVSSPKDIVGTSFSQPTTLSPGNYRWSVYAASLGGFHSQAATTQDIEVGRLPALLTPASSTFDTTPTFSWTPVGDAATYQLYINRVDVFTPGIVDVSGITGTSYTTNALPIGSYRAWVRAVSATGEISAWNVPYEFSITVETADSATIPENLLPTQLAVLHDFSLQISGSSPSRAANEIDSATKHGSSLPEAANVSLESAGDMMSVTGVPQVEPGLSPDRVSQLSLAADNIIVDVLMADTISLMLLLEI